MARFILLLIAAILIEAIVTYVQTFIVDGKFKWQMLATIALGVLVAVVYGLDLFAALGLNTNVPYIGAILTGIILSRGSNYIYDLTKQLTGIAEEVTDE